MSSNERKQHRDAFMILRLFSTAPWCRNRPWDVGIASRSAAEVGRVEDFILRTAAARRVVEIAAEQRDLRDVGHAAEAVGCFVQPAAEIFERRGIGLAHAADRQVRREPPLFAAIAQRPQSPVEGSL